MQQPIKYRCRLVVNPDESTQTAVRSILREFNHTANPIWWQKLLEPANESRPLNVVVFDEPEEVIGGLLGETCLSWLKIHIMAVREDHRGQGLGTQMLDLAEREALHRGCKYSFLDTMQHQAPKFYKRRGYEVAGMIADWDSHGHAKCLAFIAMLLQ